MNAGRWCDTEAMDSDGVVVGGLGRCCLDEADGVEVRAGIVVLPDPVEMAGAAVEDYAGEAAGGVDEFLVRTRVGAAEEACEAGGWPTA